MEEVVTLTDTRGDWRVRVTERTPTSTYPATKDPAEQQAGLGGPLGSAAGAERWAGKGGGVGEGTGQDYGDAGAEAPGRDEPGTGRLDGRMVTP